MNSYRCKSGQQHRILSEMKRRREGSTPTASNLTISQEGSNGGDDTESSVNEPKSFSYQVQVSTSPCKENENAKRSDKKRTWIRRKMQCNRAILTPRKSTSTRTCPASDEEQILDASPSPASCDGNDAEDLDLENTCTDEEQNSDASPSLSPSPASCDGNGAEDLDLEKCSISRIDTSGTFEETVAFSFSDARNALSMETKDDGLDEFDPQLSHHPYDESIVTLTPSQGCLDRDIDDEDEDEDDEDADNHSSHKSSSRSLTSTTRYTDVLESAITAPLVLMKSSETLGATRSNDGTKDLLANPSDELCISFVPSEDYDINWKDTDEATIAHEAALNPSTPTHGESGVFDAPRVDVESTEDLVTNDNDDAENTILERRDDKCEDGHERYRCNQREDFEPTTWQREDFEPTTWPIHLSPATKKVDERSTRTQINNSLPTQFKPAPTHDMKGLVNVDALLSERRFSGSKIYTKDSSEVVDPGINQIASTFSGEERMNSMLQKVSKSLDENKDQRHWWEDDSKVTSILSPKTMNTDDPKGDIFDFDNAIKQISEFFEEVVCTFSLCADDVEDDPRIGNVIEMDTTQHDHGVEDDITLW